MPQHGSIGKLQTRRIIVYCCADVYHFPGFHVRSKHEADVRQARLEEDFCKKMLLTNFGVPQKLSTPSGAFDQRSTKYTCAIHSPTLLKSRGELKLMNTKMGTKRIPSPVGFCQRCVACKKLENVCIRCFSKIIDLLVLM